jgi:hypothetical protein
MRSEIHIIINNRSTSDGEHKKYRSTQEQIDRNKREKVIQRERDERARAEANRSSNNQRGKED